MPQRDDPTERDPFQSKDTPEPKREEKDLHKSMALLLDAQKELTKAVVELTKKIGGIEGRSKAGKF